MEYLKPTRRGLVQEKLNDKLIFELEEINTIDGVKIDFEENLSTISDFYIITI